ncbi:Uncharacterized protein TCM_028975 [Theobroma cacao]|uniref:Uncharacterized protein n=1 Tax=Theobroma cacao TaxID=3641 RepID=A0A061GIY0_THECC|nr:Uncharacterized protein TCM_028975 [Theobroma cacao]
MKGVCVPKANKRTYREALIQGKKKEPMEENISRETEDDMVKDKNEKEVAKIRNGGDDKVWEIEYLVNEIEWLSRSAIRCIRGPCYYKIVQSVLFYEGTSVLIQPMGDLEVLLTFGEDDEMNVLLETYLEIFLLWFEMVIPYY